MANSANKDIQLTVKVTRRFAGTIKKEARLADQKMAEWIRSAMEAAANQAATGRAIEKENRDGA